VIPQIYLFHFSYISDNMSRSNSSIHGGRHGEEEPPVARAELHQMADSVLEAMERMLDARIPAYGRRAPRHQYDECGGENSDTGHERFRDGRGGGRRAGHHGRDGGQAHEHGRDHHVHFEDEEFDDFDHEEGSNDNENPFQMMGCLGGAEIVGGVLIKKIETSSWSS
jgi:hypothetical protein